MFTLPELPYSMTALAPHISEETLTYHHGKHHMAYVTNLNNLLPGSGFEKATLEEMIQRAAGPLFNNAAQVWNHTFYWRCLSPEGGGDPLGHVAASLTQAFGSIEAFREQFTRAAVALFGSGWVWLVRNPDGALSIDSASNAGNPLQRGARPLLTCDVWEHAYYIDYRNARHAYISAFWNVVNWEFVQENLNR